MRSTVRPESDADTADSYSADKFGNTPAATHSAASHNTCAASAFAAPYSPPTPLVPSEQPHSLSAVDHQTLVLGHNR